MNRPAPRPPRSPPHWWLRRRLVVSRSPCRRLGRRPTACSLSGRCGPPSQRPNSRAPPRDTSPPISITGPHCAASLTRCARPSGRSSVWSTVPAYSPTNVSKTSTTSSSSRCSARKSLAPRHCWRRRRPTIYGSSRCSPLSRRGPAIPDRPRTPQLTRYWNPSRRASPPVAGPTAWFARSVGVRGTAAWSTRRSRAGSLRPVWVSSDWTRVRGSSPSTHWPVPAPRRSSSPHLPNTACARHAWNGTSLPRLCRCSPTIRSAAGSWCRW